VIIIVLIIDAKIMMNTEKRKLEEKESEQTKKVKSEGDAPESLIKQLVQEVEQELSNVESDV
jgi:hypothetical protein